MNKQQLLSLTESKALRGIAILGIILHNYCHFLGFAVKENEYTFNVDKPMQLADRLLSLNHDLFIHILSFFGHYGVPLFLFISGRKPWRMRKILQKLSMRFCVQA